MGDSITEGWQQSRPEFFSGDRIDRGISGQTTSQMLGRFYADVIALHPAVVHILAGTNDIAGNGGPTSLDAIENNIRSMVELAQAHRIKVVLGTVLPAAQYSWRPDIDPVPSILALNVWIRSYARSRGVTLVDYYALLDDGQNGLARSNSKDGVHPTPAGYAKMEAALTARLNRGPKR
jgi:acyl-CoA thioesterase-1